MTEVTVDAPKIINVDQHQCEFCVKPLGALDFIFDPITHVAPVVTICEVVAIYFLHLQTIIITQRSEVNLRKYAIFVILVIIVIPAQMTMQYGYHCLEFCI